LRGCSIQKARGDRHRNEADGHTAGRRRHRRRDVPGLIASDISEISDRGSQLFILKSALVPDFVFKHITELKLLITSLCCAHPPRWGTVSSIVLAFSNALAIQPTAISTCIADLLEIYRTISAAYLNAPLNWSLRPHLLPLVQAISKGFGGPLKMDIDILLTLTEQCIIGFVPSASFVPLMTQRSSAIVNVIVHPSIRFREVSIWFPGNPGMVTGATRWHEQGSAGRGALLDGGREARTGMEEGPGSPSNDLMIRTAPRLRQLPDTPHICLIITAHSPASW
jgi:hypothetical protein